MRSRQTLDTTCFVSSSPDPPTVHWGGSVALSRLLRNWSVIGAVAIMVTASACTGGSSTADSRIAIGLVASLTGAYRDIGEDMRDGFFLYLEHSGGRLGGHAIDVVVVDEADGGPEDLATALTSVQRNDIRAVAGATTAQTANALLAALRAQGVPLVGSNGLPDLDDVTFAWSTSFRSHEPGQALAAYLRSAVDGPVWAMAADNQSGRADLAGFVDAFVGADGELANDDGTPLLTPSTTNFLPYLAAAKASGAKAVYAYYVGAEAISFVQQYAQSDARDLPLFGAGSLTEGAVLAAQGRAALGIRTVLNYAPDLDNPANRRFVDAWRAKHHRLPTAYAMASWDAAHVLDKAIAAAGTNPSASMIDAAIATVGLIDSPRGEWQFSDRHSPVQKWYLRQVRDDGRAMSNSLIQDLDILGSEEGAP
jgi:branched-chain amino acid transport system substrate-binding protein